MKQCLAKQYLVALSSGTTPEILPDKEMEMMLAKFKTYGKQPSELANLTKFERKHAILPPEFIGAVCPCCPPPPEPFNGAIEDAPKTVWKGWKRALDDELRVAGGELPWKQLRTSVIARYRQGGEADATTASAHQLGWQAMASIPEDYLSQEDELVRLPKASAF